MSLEYRDMLAAEIAERIDDLAQDLVNGNAQTFEDYKAKIGELQGLEWARVKVIEIFKTIYVREENDEEIEK